MKADQPPRPGRPPRRRRPIRRPATRPRLADTAGPDPATPLDRVRLEIGRLGAPHGIHGALHLNLTTDDPEHLATIKRVYLDDDPASRRVRAIKLMTGGEALIELQGLTTPEEARLLTGRVVRISGADARPPAPGEYFLYQLIGLRVEAEDGVAIGAVTDLLETGANDVLVVTPAAGADILLPNVPDVVLEIRPDEGRMTVRLPIFFGE